MSFSEKLRAARIRRGMTQSELAEYLNLSNTNVSKYENGALEPNLATLASIAEILNVSIDYLLEHDTPEITNDVKTLIEYYESFSDEKKQDAMKYFKMLNEFNTNK